MTKQITVKLNHDLFRPMMDELKQFGAGLIVSDSDLAAKALYFVYLFVSEKNKSGKTGLDILMNAKGMEKTEGLVKFLDRYYKFKKTGFKSLIRK